MANTGWTREQALAHIESSCGKGWLPLVHTLYDALPGGASVLQAFQKWGALGFEVEGATPALETLLDTIEAISRITCECCGAPGDEKIVRGWVSTLCDREECRLGR